MNYLMSMNHLHNNFPSNLNHDILNHDILFAFQRVKNYLNLLQIYNYINESLYRLPTSKSKYPCWSINCLYCWILLRVALVTSMKHERFRKDTIDSVTFFSGQIWWLSQRASTAGAPLLMSTKIFDFQSGAWLEIKIKYFQLYVLFSHDSLLPLQWILILPRFTNSFNRLSQHSWWNSFM